MNFFKAIFKSKKAGAAILGVLATLLVNIGLQPDLADAIVTVLSVYIAGQSAVDVGLALKGSKTE
jgi:hypothetical protein